MQLVRGFNFKNNNDGKNRQMFLQTQSMLLEEPSLIIRHRPALGEERSSTSQTMIMGVAPQKGHFEELETAAGSENGCKCGSNCTCDPCNCK